MVDLYFPQLNSGAVAHFPITKRTTTRTILNVSPDGSLTLLPDDGATRLTWDWTYTGLSTSDVSTVQQFFIACCGSLKPFTFLSPTGNLLANSSTFGADSWQRSSLVNVSEETSGPLANTTAAIITNVGQSTQEVWQSLTIPNSYEYCFSVYVRSLTVQTLSLFRRGGISEETLTMTVGPVWKRIWTPGRLEDNSIGLSVGLRIQAGQQVFVSAAQLEAQLAPSSYRATLQKGDVYQSAHWAMEKLQVACDGPNAFSIDISIEAGS